MDILDKTQGKHLKSMLGLSYSCHTTPILQALRIQKASKIVANSSLDLLRSCLLSRSSTSSFYMYLLGRPRKDMALVARSRSLCDSYNIDMMKYVLSDDYKTITKQTVSPVISPGTNGLVDSVRALLSDYTADKHKILRVLLKSI